jgi:hypothetical protein
MSAFGTSNVRFWHLADIAFDAIMTCRFPLLSRPTTNGGAIDL